MEKHISVPRSILSVMVCLATERAAMNLGPGSPILHPGDGFGSMLTWLLRTDPELARQTVSDYVDRLRLSYMQTGVTLEAERAIFGFAVALQVSQDQEAQNTLNGWLADTLAYLIAT